MNKKTTLITGMLLLLVVGSWFVYWTIFSNNSMSSSENNTEVSETANSPEEQSNIKEDSQPDPSNPITEADSEPDQPTSNNSANDNSSITNVVLSGVDTTPEGLRFSSIISGANKNDECTITFTKSGQSPITRTSGVVLVTDYYACKGFTVPANTFPASGTWSAQITAGDMKSNTMEFEISL